MADEEERLARATLTQLIEPGDEAVGRALSEAGPCELVRAVMGGGPRPDAIGAVRWEGLRTRARAAPPPVRGLERVAALDGRFVCPGDHEWPRQLDDLGPSRPVGLWVRGAAGLRFLALRSVAVVGARACTDYGAHVASVLGAGLAGRGWTVVSGGAYGVDSAAHRGALASGGATVGVLACGVDRFYPAGNAPLIGRIGEQGLLVAELPPGAHPSRSRFVLRNRVIAALTRGTVVVEAAVRSGSLSTARHAQRLGRFTMGTPGPVTSGLSAGVHRLLREEGTLVTDADEVVELLGEMGELAPEPLGRQRPHDLLPPEAARVLDALPAKGEVETEAVAQEAALDPGRTAVRLQELWSLGFAERVGGSWKLAGRSGDPIE